MKKILAYLLTPLLLLTAINSLYAVRLYRQLAMNTPQRYNQTGQEVSPHTPIEREQEPVEKTAQTLLIFLDDFEKNRMGALSISFLAAFLQEAVPILVSSSLLNNMRNYNYLEKDSPEVIARINEIKEKNYGTRSQEEEKYERDFLSSISVFKNKLKERWIIKEINDYLYLLLPKALFLKDIEGIKSFIPQKKSNNNETLELRLGLAVNHFKTVTEKEIKQPNDQPESAKYFIDSLETLFITNKHYPLDKKNLIPLWNIYIHGHGYIGESIVNLSIEQFKKFLCFLEKIKTVLLVYVSCYAAGVNAERIYKTEKGSLAKTYDFPIITLGLNDIIVWGQRLHSLIDPISKEFLTINMNPDYKTFIEKLQSIDQRDYPSIIKHINISLNIPQIKYPGLPWFSVLEQNRVIPIGSIMGKTRTTPLTIENYYTKKDSPIVPDAILLYAKDILFKIKSNYATSNNYPKFISMIPGDATHTIKEISSEKAYVEDILQAFYIKDLVPNKSFYIGSITGLLSDNMKKVLDTDDTSATINKVRISSDNGHLNVFFLYKESLYAATEKDIFTVITIKKSLPERIPYYEEDFHEMYREETSSPSDQNDYQKEVDVRSTEELLTPEKIAKIKVIQKAKIKKQRGEISIKQPPLIKKEKSPLMQKTSKRRQA